VLGFGLWCARPDTTVLAEEAAVPTAAAIPNPKADAKTQQEMQKYTDSIPGTNVTFELTPIPGGEFLMGSPDTEAGHKPNESPQHKVKIAPFWMGTHEVTWNEYDIWSFNLDIRRREVNKEKGTPLDKFADAVTRPTKPYTDMTFGMGHDGYPAICMTHLAARTYCKWLSAKTGRFYRLPTEAEWEYACRAGTTTPWSFGSDKSKFGDYAWYDKNKGEGYHKVGLKKPNPWGLFDIHGNVAEWCLDHYFPDAYKKSPAANPLFPSTEDYTQVARGGSWQSEKEEDCRSAARDVSTEEWKQQDPQLPKSIWFHTDATFVGFRIVRPLEVPNAVERAKYE
jgi:formylglycine-generating enzyme required for sulfatase activity